MTKATKVDGNPLEIWVVVNEVLTNDREDLFYSRYLSHKHHVSRSSRVAVRAPQQQTLKRVL
jgi:hypothetical protein